MSRHGVLSIQQALFNVFVAPNIQKSASILPRSKAIRPANRTFTTTQSLAFIKKKKSVEPEVRKEKWNEEITAPYVRLVHVETNTLSDPRRPRDIMRNLDMTQYRLVQVAEAYRNDADSLPLCKIINKKEEQKQKQANRLAKKDTLKQRAIEQSVKTVELNWAIDSNDMQHRMNKVKEFLSEGRKVEIVFARKKRGRQATPAEIQQVVKKLYATLDEVPGARENKPMDGEIGVVAMFYLQGKAPAEAQEPAPTP